MLNYATSMDPAASTPAAIVQSGYPNREKVLQALNSQSSVWRSVDGLAKDTNLSKGDVLAELEALPPETLAVTNSKDGRLYTTREHYFKNQSFLGRFLTYATGQFK